MQADPAISVTRHLLTPAMGLVHDCAQFLNGEGRLGNEFSILAHPGAMGHVHLDPVGAMIELLACCFTRFDRTIYDLRSLRHFEFRCISLQRVAGGSRNRPSGDDQTWAGYISIIDRLLDPYIPVACAFGLYVAQGSKSLLQRAAGCDRRPCRPQCQWRTQDIRVVPTLGRILSLQENVRVRIDQTRHNRLLREINHAGTVRYLCTRRVRNVLNPVAANHDYLIVPRLVSLPVDQRAGANRRYLVSRGLARLLSSCVNSKREKQRNPETFHGRSSANV